MKCGGGEGRHGSAVLQSHYRKLQYTDSPPEYRAGGQAGSIAA